MNELSPWLIPLCVVAFGAMLSILLRESVWIYRTTIKKDAIAGYKDGGKSYHSRSMFEDAVMKIPQALNDLNTNLTLSNERLIQLSKSQDQMHQSLVIHLSEIKGQIKK